MISRLLSVRKKPLTKEETWTLSKAEPDTQQEPRGREVELEYKIMSTSTTNYNQFKWHKKKKKHWQTKLRQWCQLRMITSVKSRPFILESLWQLSISWNHENNNLLLFLEPQQITILACSIYLTEHSLKGCVGVVTIHLYVTWGYDKSILLFKVNSLLKSFIAFTRSQNASLELWRSQKRLSSESTNPNNFWVNFYRHSITKLDH